MKNLLLFENFNEDFDEKFKDYKYVVHIGSDPSDADEIYAVKTLTQAKKVQKELMKNISVKQSSLTLLSVFLWYNDDQTHKIIKW